MHKCQSSHMDASLLCCYYCCCPPFVILNSLVPSIMRCWFSNGTLSCVTAWISSSARLLDVNIRIDFHCFVQLFRNVLVKLFYFLRVDIFAKEKNWWEKIPDSVSNGWAHPCGVCHLHHHIVDVWCTQPMFSASQYVQIQTPIRQ